MEMKDFIIEQRERIDEVINGEVNNAEIDDDERELWVMNDESLYLYAKSKGVNI